MDKRANFEQWLKNRIEDYQAAIDKLRLDLKDNPAAALEWAQDAFTAAGHIRVYRQVLKALESPQTTLESIHAFALNELRQRAGSPKRSTSQASNLLDQEVTAGWADLVELVDGFIKSKG